MARLFGTDGVRGLANGLLTAELALDLSVSAAHVLGAAGATVRGRPSAVVGRDPRLSGDFLEAAVVAGLSSAGVDVLRVGVVTTPALAYLTADRDADLGVMISASHNPMPDNGIKFFARGGRKLDDDVEDAIEAGLGSAWSRPVGADVGRVRDDASVIGRYVAHLLSIVPRRLDGLRLVLDCAEGSASQLAPEVFAHLGASVTAIHAEPDGVNINEGCGSTHLGPVRDAVLAEGADAGFAFDGDADRVLAVDAGGEVVDGDQLMAVLALALKDSDSLAGGRVVATVMSNLGFTLAMREAGIEVVTCDVGDRYVLEAMARTGASLGGEQSGHVVLASHATTGDGLLTALLVAAQLPRTGRGLADLASVVTRLPQVLVNVAGVDRSRTGTDPELTAAVAAAEAELGTTGRVLLRPSGTEPVVRVMVEAPSEDQARAVADRLAVMVQRRLSP